MLRLWYPIRDAEKAEVGSLLGRPVTEVDVKEGIYVDEEGTVFQLAGKGETKPILVEETPVNGELEQLLAASLKNGKTPDPRPAANNEQAGEGAQTTGRIQGQRRRISNVGSRDLSRKSHSSGMSRTTAWRKSQFASISGKSWPRSGAGSATSRNADSMSAATTPTSPQRIWPVRSGTSWPSLEWSSSRAWNRSFTSPVAMPELK